MREHGYMERKLQLLHNITGAFQPGVLSALMGVTGAGKTTLLDVLAGRKTGGVIEGDIRIGGYPKIQQTFARISGYCEQTDVHSPQITVGESVAYSAWLRLPPEIDSKTRNVSSMLSYQNKTYIYANLYEKNKSVAYSICIGASNN
jgi:ABC-type multidrug transport system ATPase subunit